MPESLLVETLGLVRQHPWWQARAKLALAVGRQNGLSPPMTVLDVGCGWGVNLETFEAAGFDVVGLDVSRRMLELLNTPRRLLIEADLCQEPPATATCYDGILMLDVLEHLDDDRGALRHAARLVRPGALIVVSVPALPELRSEFDELQGHRRRYLPETLRAAFEGTGFAVRSVFWWGSWMVPVLRWTRQQGNPARHDAAVRYAHYLRLPPWPVPLVMQQLFRREQRLALQQRLRTGTSLFVVGQRQA
jgi:SAM-dependent methyltransferase